MKFSVLNCNSVLVIFMTFLFGFTNSKIRQIQQKCADKMTTCDLIVKYELCNNQAYYIVFCCASCTKGKYWVYAKVAWQILKYSETNDVK